MGTAAMTDKQALRRQFRTLREERDDQAIRNAVAALLKHASGTGHLGLYWPLKGEIRGRCCLHCGATTCTALQ